ncbi:MAG: UxaA family hydrolase [Casimicrobiaceae bacterium]
MRPASQSFLGYLRPDGSVGTRNYLLVLSVGHLTGPTARRVARALPGSRLVLMPYGGGIIGKDRVVQMRSIAGFGRNPNVGAVLLIGTDGPKLAELADEIRSSRKLVRTLCLDDVSHDALSLSDKALREGAQLHREISRERRVCAPLSALCVGVECGRSDPSSGIVANPLIGAIVDRLIDAGGRVIFGETLEWLGAEHLLATRAASPIVREALVAAVLRREQLAVSSGINLVGNNPNPTNVVAGLSTIEEKSLGSIAKSGSRPIDGVVGIGEPVDVPGLYAMDAPAFTPESLSGFVASGAQLLLFSTGVGNSYVSALAPTVKLSANPVAARTLAQQLDFEASGVFAGTQSMNEAANALMDVILDIASGTLTWGEVLDEGDEVVSRVGEAL